MSEMMKTAADALVKKAQGLDRLSEYWSSLPDVTRSTLVNTLIGGGIGGALGGGMGRMAGDSPLKYALIGALLGGTTGGAGTLGWNMVRGNVRMPGEPAESRPISDTAVDAAMKQIISNPGTAAGLGIGGTLGYLRWPEEGAIGRAMGEYSTQLNRGHGGTTAEMEAIRRNLREHGTYTMPVEPKPRRPGGPVPQHRIAAFMADKPYDSIEQWRRYQEIREHAQAAANEASAIRRMGAAWRTGGMPLPAVGSALESLGNRVAEHRYLSRMVYGRGVSSPARLAGLLALTTGLGYMTDRYLKGRNT